MNPIKWALLGLLLFFFSTQLALSIVNCSLPSNCLEEGMIETPISTKLFISKLQYMEKFFGHHSLYHAFVLDMEKLIGADLQEDRFLLLSDILDPNGKYSSLEEALNGNLEDIGFSGAEIIAFHSILDDEDINPGEGDGGGK